MATAGGDVGNVGSQRPRGGHGSSTVRVTLLEAVPRRDESILKRRRRGNKVGKKMPTIAKGSSPKERLQHVEETTRHGSIAMLTVKEAASGLGKASGEGDGGEVHTGAEAATTKTCREAKTTPGEVMKNGARV